MYIHVTYLYNSIHVITSQTRWFIDVHVVQKTTPRIGWGEELLVILIVGAKSLGFLQFSLTSPLNKATQSPKSLLKAFKIFWGDLKIPLKIPSEHIPSLSNTSNQKTPFIKPQWHAEAASVCPAWNLGRTGSAAGCFQWLSLVKGDWMKPRKDLSNMFSTGGRYIYIYIIHTHIHTHTHTHTHIWNLCLMIGFISITWICQVSAEYWSQQLIRTAASLIPSSATAGADNLNEVGRDRYRDQCWSDRAAGTTVGPFFLQSQGIVKPLLMKKTTF